MKDVQTLAQEQLEAYNTKNLEAFLKPYAPLVEAYDLAKGELLFKGLEAMAARYGPCFKANPGLHCDLMGRWVMGHFCIDQESITGLASGSTHQAIAIYQAESGLISKIWFLRKDPPTTSQSAR